MAGILGQACDLSTFTLSTHARARAAPQAIFCLISFFTVFWWHQVRCLRHCQRSLRPLGNRLPCAVGFYT